MASSITTLASLYTEITRLLDGEDPTVSDLSVATLSRLVSVAQQRIYGDVRCRYNEVAWGLTAVSGNSYALPADYETDSIVYVDGQVLTAVDEYTLRDYANTSGGSWERYFAQAGNTLVFAPALPNGTTLSGRYYARLPDLTDATIATNALFQAADDLFVYAALVESAVFFGEQKDQPVWEAKYKSIVERLNQRARKAPVSAGKPLSMYSLYLEVTRLLDGTGTSDLEVGALARLMVAAQRRIYRDVRCRWNERAWDGVAAVSNLAVLPDDFEAASMVHIGRQMLIPVDEATIRDYWSTTGGTERYFAHAGNALTFWPALADGTALQGRYYARLPDLTNANLTGNALYMNADDLFIYGALVESAAFFGQRPEMPVWEEKYKSIVERVNRADHRAAYSVGRLMIRPSARICGGRGWGGAGGGASIESGGLDVDGQVDIQ